VTHQQQHATTTATTATPTFREFFTTDATVVKRSILRPTRDVDTLHNMTRTDKGCDGGTLCGSRFQRELWGTASVATSPYL
jgi:hypothetical protein